GYASAGKYFRIASSTNLNSGVLFQIGKTGTTTLNSGITTNSTGLFLCINSTTFEVERSSTACSGTSDERLKTNIASLGGEGSLDDIEKLNPVSFNWKSINDATTTQFGFLAQEVENIFPNLVTVNSGTYTIANADGTQTIVQNPMSLNYTGFIPVLAKGIQELASSTASTTSSLAASVSLNSAAIASTIATLENLQKSVTSLADITTVGAGLTLSSTTLTLDVANPNIWTGLQTFNAASTTALSASDYIEVGSAATTSASTTNTMVRGNATSTFSGGIDIENGCIAINGTCVLMATSSLQLSVDSV